MEKITHERGDTEAWICVCGNTPSGAGFYPCDANGNEMEPTIGSGWTGLYVCNDKECRREQNRIYRKIRWSRRHHKSFASWAWWSPEPALGVKPSLKGRRHGW